MYYIAIVKMNLEDRLDQAAKNYFTNTSIPMEDAFAYWNQRKQELGHLLLDQHTTNEHLKSCLVEAQTELKYIKRERDDLLRHSFEKTTRVSSRNSSCNSIQDSIEYAKAEVELFKTKAEIAAATAELEDLEEQIEVLQLKLNKKTQLGDPQLTKLQLQSKQPFAKRSGGNTTRLT